MAVKRHNPGCPCCTSTCDPTCFTVTACAVPAEGATVEIYATASPGVVLYSGTLDVNGEWCVDLSAEVGTDLSATISYGGDFADYVFALGGFCGRTYTISLRPNTAGGGGTSGKLTVTLRNNAGTLLTSGQSRVFRPTNLVTPVATVTQNGSGQAIFTGLPTGEPLLFNSGPTSGASQNFPEFTLTCEGTATAKEGDEFGEGQEWSFTGTDCGDPEPQHCCSACTPELVPHKLCVTDPCAGFVVPTRVPNVFLDCILTCNGCESVDTTLTFTSSATFICDSTPYEGWFGRYLETNLCSNGQTYQGGATVEYLVFCSADKVYLRLMHSVSCYQLPAYASPILCGASVATLSGPYGGCWYDIEATSYTCNPFSATFDIPSFSGPCNDGGTITIPARTITVVEGAC